MVGFTASPPQSIFLRERRRTALVSPPFSLSPAGKGSRELRPANRDNRMSPGSVTAGSDRGTRERQRTGAFFSPQLDCCSQPRRERPPAVKETLAGGYLWRVAILSLALAAGSGWAANRAVLVRELPFPRMALDLEIPFNPSELQVPPSANLEADIKALEAELAKGDQPELQLRMARLLRFAGRTQEAALYYRLAVGGYQALLQSEPENAQAHLGYSEALLQLGEDAEAVAHLEEALCLDETLWKAHTLSAEIHVTRATAWYARGDMVRAATHLAYAEEEAKEAVRLAPTEAEAKVTLFITRWVPVLLDLQRDPRMGLTQLGTYEELSELLKQAAQLAPHFPRLRFFAITAKLTPFFAAQMLEGYDKGLSDKLDQSQRRVLTACRDEYVALANEAPGLRSEALLFAGLACFMLDEEKPMLEYWRASADAAPTSTTALEAMLGYLASKGRWAQAQPLAQEMHQRRPSGKSQCWLGRILGEQGKWKLAEEAFRSAISYQDAIGTANLGLGVVLLKSGADPAAAIPPLRVAREKLGEDPTALLALGVALVLAGQEQEGKSHVRRALEMLEPSPATEKISRELGLTATP